MHNNSLLVVAVATMALNVGCNHNVSEPPSTLLEEATKTLMISEAQQGFKELHKESFNPEETELLVGSEVQKWLHSHRPLVKMPDPTKGAIENNHAIALLIHGGLPMPGGGHQDVVYLRSPQFGVRLFLNGEVDPCGDGNPTMCEFCSGGCDGAGGTGCYCTMGCGSCRVCPRC